MIRKILAIVAGLVAAFLIILLVEGVDERLYPVPADLDTTDAAALGAYVFAMPLAAKLLVVAGWLLGALGGVWLCLRISDRRWTGWIIVLLLIAGGVANMIQFGHPLWRPARSSPRCSAAGSVRDCTRDPIRASLYSGSVDSVSIIGSAQRIWSRSKASRSSAPTLCAVARLRNKVASRLARVDGGGGVRRPPDKARDSLTDNAVIDPSL